MVLYVEAKAEPWIKLNDIEGFCAETSGSEWLRMIEEAIGCFEAYNSVIENPEKILNFLKQYL
jgi:hypothetical protein